MSSAFDVLPQKYQQGFFQAYSQGYSDFQHYVFDCEHLD
jgi:hypothetical protein